MQRTFKITVNGKNYDVSVEEMGGGAAAMMPSYSPSVASVATAAPVAAAAPAAVAAPAGAGDQTAQMGGVVSAILVKEGQSVAEGDRIVELEAMKMKVPVMATRGGQVAKIRVAVGDAVETGQVLLTIA